MPPPRELPRNSTCCDVLNSALSVQRSESGTNANELYRSLTRDRFYSCPVTATHSLRVPLGMRLFVMSGFFWPSENKRNDSLNVSRASL